MITNDDGIDARGIHVLTKIASEYADVVVCAPNKGYSGQSHSITVMAPLTVAERTIDGAHKAYAVGGSPVDCIKLGYHALVDRKPVLVLSGINHGSNASASVHYSGTLGGAREAAMLGVRGLGFSLCDYSKDADFGAVEPIIKRVIEAALKMTDDEGTYYNVNIPCGEVKGLKVCRVANGMWREDPTEFTDPYGQKYYWLEGTFCNVDNGPQDTDDYWLSQGYATISPCQLEVTNFDRMAQLEKELQ